MQMKIRLALLFLCCLSFFAAGQIAISRNVPGNATFGEIIEVRINLTNEGEETNITVMEKVNGLRIQEEELVKNTSYYDDYGYGYEMPYPGLTVNFLEWNLTLSRGETKSLSYHIIAGSSDILLPPTTVLTSDGRYYGEAQAIRLFCSPDDRCDLASGENFLNCPDCSTGLADGICDSAPDGVNDPDCSYGADPDYNASADTDKDGIYDGMDACPQTPAGEGVDAEGCSCSQKLCRPCNPTTGECIAPTPTPMPSPVSSQTATPAPAQQSCCPLVLILLFAMLFTVGFRRC